MNNPSQDRNGGASTTNANVNANAPPDQAPPSSGVSASGNNTNNSAPSSSTTSSSSSSSVVSATTNNGSSSANMATTDATHRGSISSATPPRSSSTESESAQRRSGGAFDRNTRMQSENDDEEEDDAEEDDEEDEDDDESRSSSRRSSQSGGAQRPHPPLHPQNTMRQPPPPQSSSSSSAVPSSSGASRVQYVDAHRSNSRDYDSHMLMNRASPTYASSTNANTALLLHHRQHQQYYSSAPGSPMVDSGGRMVAPKRRLNTSDYAPPSMDHDGASSPMVRAMYEATMQHASSSTSSSGGDSRNRHTLVHHQASDRGGGSGGGGGPPPAGDDEDDDHHDPNDDPLRFETRGSHGPRDEQRYETWTSKQLRKKCSHLKLRGLKNVKKHVMVEALYRYYRNQRAKQAGVDLTSHLQTGANTVISNSGRLATSSSNPSSSSGKPSAQGSKVGRYAAAVDVYDAPTSSQRYDPHNSMSAPASVNGTTYLSPGLRTSHRPSGGISNSATPSLVGGMRRHSPSSSTSAVGHARVGRSMAGGGYSSSGATIDADESKYDALDNEIRITSEDVIRLVDVILSPEFVDRLSNELSRWQFWVDVREKYISLVNMNVASSYGAARGLTALGGDVHGSGGADGGASGGRGAASGGGGAAPQSSGPMASMYMRPSAKWSSMQLWEMWKELTFAYTKTCFEFTAAGMRSVDERNYIQFCEGRPDVYYLHQRLHARPDLLHLIKSNEYIEEKCSSDAASEQNPLNAENNAANTLIGVGAADSQRNHKRFKRIVPAGATGGAGGGSSGGSGGVGQSSSSGGGLPGGNGGGAGGNSGNGGVNGPPGTTTAPASAAAPAGTVGRAQGSSGGGQYLTTNGSLRTNDSPNAQQEEGSTENSETTGEEGSLEKTNSNSNSSQDSTRREALNEQKYFGLLLQNFEAIFESLHNKKVLLAALRKDTNAPDHLIADLHDDIHVLSALKKEFRNKLQQALE